MEELKMNNKRFLALAQQEDKDEGQISELRKINIINYNMLLLGGIIVFVIRALKKEPTIDLTFMLIFSMLGQGIYRLKKNKSVLNLIVVFILSIAVLSMGWTLVRVFFK
ncbi:hypothetical protein RU87_GL000564 [Lactococcus plantarum]|uniref:Uncharacterized protein n=2 Tax=Pseudolactococcus plantarum TaxID=1365 RepID=A0A2A5RVY1_9LACT|nr:hypothetical protein RU87_GL000564 [Lactococcus plantarum]